MSILFFSSRFVFLYLQVLLLRLFLRFWNFLYCLGFLWSWMIKNIILFQLKVRFSFYINPNNLILMIFLLTQLRFQFKLTFLRSPLTVPLFIFTFGCDCFLDFRKKNNKIMNKLDQPRQKVENYNISVNVIHDARLICFFIDVKSENEDQSQNWSYCACRCLKFVFRTQRS